MELTAQELIILIILIILIAKGLIADVLKIVACIAFYLAFNALIFGTTPDKVVEGIKDAFIDVCESFGAGSAATEIIDTGSEWIEENKDGWIGSAYSLRFKLLGIEKPEE